MEIQQNNGESKGQFEASDNGIQAGVLAYIWAGPGKFIIDHTEVNPDFAGQGIGRKLVWAAVNYARENKVKILPLCPFAKSVFDKTSEIQDVLF
ncbi:GNAT family N-acetyltransferase [Pedobacter terrae]|uniref:GNAT family N-acetyltransferase n=1 Tax=Pedobacter terrae TaxID=405671 RepID=UPI002FF62329